MSSRRSIIRPMAGSNMCGYMSGVDPLIRTGNYLIAPNWLSYLNPTNGLQPASVFPGLGSTFKIDNQVELAGLKDDPVIICGNHGTNSDDLDGVPIL